MYEGRRLGRSPSDKIISKENSYLLEWRKWSWSWHKRSFVVERKIRFSPYLSSFHHCCVISTAYWSSLGSQIKAQWTREYTPSLLPPVWLQSKTIINWGNKTLREIHKVRRISEMFSFLVLSFKLEIFGFWLLSSPIQRRRSDDSEREGVAFVAVCCAQNGSA